ncbi:hypothetical protein SAMN06264364_1202 [Quadrisphaera granulorum]|uniref:Uncharacterized protein n=1 Tax=Quadrisphaera granulorum TaxID=317664 RepID=A0A316A4K2_9ACTN|nr:hypothetical protein BXY45_1202 [Quadrisphaera granulorum]SZE97671.1 hypothetical protein SAMN06264364_1202 [Quadrisphaera granulorum]
MATPWAWAWIRVHTAAAWAVNKLASGPEPTRTRAVENACAVTIAVPASTGCTPVATCHIRASTPA